MLMPERQWSYGSGYRYGFNGKENDNEVKGTGNQQDYGMRIYDPRIGKFLSVDPLTQDFPFYTPYQFAGNKPIWCVDLDGAEDLPYYWQLKQYNDWQTATPEERRTMAEAKRTVEIATVLILAVGVDVLFTKGWVTRTALQVYTGTQLANSIEHNRASTPEARIEQNKRTRNALADAVIGYGMGKAVGVVTKIVAETGKVVYKTFQSTSIRFSQSSVKGSSYTEVKALMAEGKDLGAIDIVKMKDGIYTSLDNKRLMAAQELGQDIKAISHNYDDILDATTQKRIFEAHGINAKTWGEAIEARTSGQAKYISRDSPNGSFIKPKVSKK
jgi:RHS repeat-associated protein